MSDDGMKMIDPTTGQAPVLGNGDSFSFTQTIIIDDGIAMVVPDGLDADSEECMFVEVTQENPDESK